MSGQGAAIKCCTLRIISWQHRLVQSVQAAGGGVVCWWLWRSQPSVGGVARLHVRRSLSHRGFLLCPLDSARKFMCDEPKKTPVVPV